jgi:zinc protease
MPGRNAYRRPRFGLLSPPGRSLVSLAIALSCACSALPAWSQSPAGSREITTRTLPNGLEVIVAPSGSVPLVTVEVVVRNGAFTQLTPEEEGLPHLLEHMLFKSEKSFLERASEMGGISNGTTGAEAVTYHITVPAEHLDEAMSLMSDLVRDPRFEEDDLEQERGVVRGELEQASTDPFQVFAYYERLFLWGDASPRKSPGGSLVTLAQATVGLLDRYYRRFYVPNNAALIVSGRVDPGRAFESAERRFSRWESGADPFAALDLPPIPPLGGDTVFVVPHQASGITFSVVWHGPSAREDPRGTVVAQVLAAVGNSSLGPFQRALVDPGLFQEVAFSFEPLNHVGPLRLVARTMPEKLPEAAHELRDLLGRLGTPAFISAADLETAKAALRVDRALQEEEIPSVAHQLATDWSISGVEAYRGYDAAVRAVTLDDLHAFATRYLEAGHRAVGMLVAQETVEEHQDVLVRSLEGWIRP